MVIDGWSTSRNVLYGFNPTTYRPTTIDLDITVDMNAVASQTRTKIPFG